MKPRTKLEKEVTWLSSHLLPPSMEQIEDAKEHLFDGLAYYTKKHGYDCMECGHRFRVPVSYTEGLNVTCPHCHKMLSVERARKLRDSEIKYYMLMQTVWHDDREIIVQRLFEIRKHMKRLEPASYSLRDVAEYYTADGEQVCLGIPLGQFGRWNYQTPMSVRHPQKYASYYGGSYRSYQFDPDYVAIESVASVLTRNGFCNEYEDYIPQKFVELLMCNPQAEQMYKLDHRLINHYNEDILSQVKIANRHHYRISDVGMWVDAIKLLRRLELDDRNPKHLCPEDLNHWHDVLLARWNRKQERERTERQRIANLARLEKEKPICEEYVKRIARFLQLNIQDELISIKPIPTVQAVSEEGTAMHHCVFQCGYYKEPNVLLLSARDRFGNRVETIEVNLETYQVAQSRGKCNQNSEHHNRILSLMAQGMSQIREMNTQNINIKVA